MYTSLARLYDRLMDDVDYSAWADYYIRLLRIYGADIQSVCECACGTGSLTCFLAEYPLKITACDISEDMLRVASEKARKKGVRIPFIRQDMRCVELPRHVDGIIAACDGVNYLTDEASLDAFLKSSFSSLKGGGTLAFDVSSTAKFLSMDGRVYCDERDDAACIWSCTYDAGTGILTMDVSLYIRMPGGLYQRLGEKHVQKGRSAEDIVSALKKAGFRDIRVFGDRTLEAPSKDEQRLHFTAYKPIE
ncbi:MAG: class I SAM-dependent methyltransferase [Clostridia bacterium]|nr:class I SAM-dependent methyltransferase [Clostridia bacterium]